MAFRKISTKATESEQGSGYISKSGIYDAHLKGIEVASTTNGATQLNYYFDTVNSFNNIVISKDNNPTFGMDVLDSLGFINGMSDSDTIADPEPTNIKFNKGPKELNCLPDFLDIDCKVWVQFQYHIWNNEIKEKVVVKRFYRADDNASGSELSGASKDPIGTNYSKDEAYAARAKYDDGLTEEKITEWQTAQADERKGSTPAVASTNKGSAAAFPGQ